MEETKNVKRKTKAAGLKSVLVSNNKIILTSFGQGNEAVKEKELQKNEVVFEKEPPAFQVDADENFLYINGKNYIKAQADNPLKNEKVGQDNLRAKDMLEVRYFGKKYNDNIRIQLIYNILDINKILAPHINNIVFAVNNLQRNVVIYEHDLVGCLNARNSYEVFCNPRNTRFSKDDKKNNDIIKSIEYSKTKFDKFLKDAKPYMTYMNGVFVIGKKN